MTETRTERSSHPCIVRRCGHATEAHTRTPELEGSGETVLWCAGCRRHEVRATRRPWLFRGASLAVREALPLRPV